MKFNRQMANADEPKRCSLRESGGQAMRDERVVTILWPNPATVPPKTTSFFSNIWWYSEIYGWPVHDINHQPWAISRPQRSAPDEPREDLCTTCMHIVSSPSTASVGMSLELEN